jgi:CBS domain-containing protein
VNTQPTNPTPKAPAPSTAPKDFQAFYFSELLNRPVCTGKIKDRLGRLGDLVFRVAEPYPEAVGLYIEHGWGKPTEFIAWEKVSRIEDDAIFVAPPEGGRYPPFVDQPGWIMLNEHLMGRTILDMDGRRVEVVNDVHLLLSKNRMALVHVDVSFNGFLRKWGLGWLTWVKDQYISWRYVQPLSLEDVGTSDSVSLSVTRKRLHELPVEDLADALEQLTGEEQQAVFSALDSETAAEALVEAEPRAQRQLIATLRRERARTILSELSVPQLADLLSVLPHHDQTKMLELLPGPEAQRIKTIITQREVNARALMSLDYIAVPREARAGQVLRDIRVSKREHDTISYVYVIAPDTRLLLGVVDLRDLVLASDDTGLGDLMVSPVVSAQEDDVREDLEELFAKYHYRLVPVVDAHDSLLGVVRYKDIMSGLTTRART